MKICTSIEQSRELMELGLDPKTADMLWINYCDDDYDYRLGVINNPNEELNEDIPAWSLSALLERLPLYVMSQFGGYHLNIERKEGAWKCGYCFYESSIGGDIYFAYSFVEDSFPAIEKPDLMDAVYEMMMNYLRFAKKFLPHAYFVKEEPNNK